jgi:hypothetical protein
MFTGGLNPYCYPSVALVTLVRGKRGIKNSEISIQKGIVHMIYIICIKNVGPGFIA